MSIEQYSNVLEMKREEMLPVALRLAGAPDFASVKKLNLSALELDPSAFGAQSRKREKWTDEEWKHFIQAGYIQVGVNEKGDLVAMAGAKKKEEEEGVWQLHSVYIDPLYRKNVDEKERRLSERLITELINTLRDEEKATQIDLIVNQEKPAAVKLYERLGFVTTEELHGHPSADGELHEKFAMSKVITREEKAIPLAA